MVILPSKNTSNHAIDESGYVTIFNADRDNQGQGLSVDTVLKILRQLNAEH